MVSFIYIFLYMIEYRIDQPARIENFDVTVIVAVKNGVDSLEACLLSIFNQEGTKVGVIVVDGGSTDGTLQIVERYRPSLFAVLNDANLGVYDAWNRALEFCYSPWIAFLGCDDRYSDKLAVAKLLAATKRTDEVPVFVYSKVSLRDSADQELKVLGEPWEKAKVRLKYRMSVLHCGALHARKLFDSGGFNTSFRIVGDYEFLYRQRRRLVAVFVEEPLVIARSGGLSTRSDLAITQKLEVKRVFSMHRAGFIVNISWYLGMSATLASLALSRFRNSIE